MVPRKPSNFKREEYEEVYNLPDNVFQKPKKQKCPSEVPKMDKNDFLIEKPQQQVVDDDFLKKAFEDKPSQDSSPMKSPLKSPEKANSPLKSPVKSPTKSPTKEKKPEEIKAENPFLRNLIKEESQDQSTKGLGSNDTSQEQAKSESQQKEEFEVMNDDEQSRENEDAESRGSDEDHEAYEQEPEPEEEVREEEEKEENYIQSEGLGDILEASNENSENLELKSPMKEDEVQEEEKEEVGRDKKEDLMEKYEEAVKREKELKNIIDVKVKECEKVLGKKTYEEIIGFFRSKLNVSLGVFWGT